MPAYVATNRRLLLRGTTASMRRRTARRILYTEFPTSGTTVTDLPNFQPEIGPAENGASFERHPSSASVLRMGGTSSVNQQNQLYNSSGSSRGIYRAVREPGTTNYTVVGSFKINSIAGNGNSVELLARVDPVLQTYYSLYAFATSGVVSAKISKYIAGTETSFGVVALGTATIGDEWQFMLHVANDGKVAYVQGPTETHFRRLSSTGDNAIPGPGFAGIAFLRSSSNGGMHLTSFGIDVNGPEEPSGVSQAPTPDPVQAPALLWEPQYTAATVDVGGTGRPWYRQQKPYVGGTLNQDSAVILDNGDLPGVGQTYRPAGRAVRFRLDSFHNANDFTVTLAADVASTDTSITVTDASALVTKMFLNFPDGDVMRVTGAPTGNEVPVQRDSSPTVHVVGEVASIPMGDVNDSGSIYQTSRVELYDRFSTSGGGADPATWPDPVGSIRYYGFSIHPASDFALTGGGTNPWVTLTQWKQQYGGSPVRALEVDVSGTPTFKLGGTNTHIGLGAFNRGTWTRFVFGFRWETSPANGWVMVWRDGALILPKRYEATMAKHGSGADPQYFKDGIYRTKSWTTQQTTYIGPVKIGTTLADVFDP